VWWWWECNNSQYIFKVYILMLLVGWQEGYLGCKIAIKTNCVCVSGCVCMRERVNVMFDYVDTLFTYTRFVLFSAFRQTF